MAKHKKGADSAINTESWMMSYADMATVLLAMFIVLSTLGQDQTGINLQRGLESWRDSRASFGLGGLFQTSGQLLQRDHLAPNYIAHDPDAPPDARGSGPDKDDGPRAHDLEHEQLQRFLAEMGRQFPVEKLPRTTGDAAVDFYDRLNASPPYLTPRQSQVIWQLLPLLHKENYRVVLVVWATTPSDSAWARAASQARLVADEIAAAANLDTHARNRLVAVGQPWRYAGFERPVMSVCVSKSESPP